MWKNLMITLAIGALTRIAKSVSKAIWEGLWNTVYLEIERAEIRWRESGSGELKKKYVVDMAMYHLETRGLLKWGSAWLVRMALEWSVDEIIKKVNEDLGRNWVDSVKGLKVYLEGKWSFLK